MKSNDHKPFLIFYCPPHTHRSSSSSRPAPVAVGNVTCARNVQTNASHHTWTSIRARWSHASRTPSTADVPFFLFTAMCQEEETETSRRRLVILLFLFFSSSFFHYEASRTLSLHKLTHYLVRPHNSDITSASCHESYPKLPKKNIMMMS